MNTLSSSLGQGSYTTLPPSPEHYVNLAPAHATPNGVSLLRCSVCAAHSREQLERILDVFQAIGTELGLLEEQRLAVAQ